MIYNASEDILLAYYILDLRFLEHYYQQKALHNELHQEVFRWVGPCNSTWVCSEIRGIPHIPNILHESTPNFVDLCRKYHVFRHRNVYGKN
ncbi:hypothetical protein RIR_jg40078.t1 [Rhizophagus irregularis DAOM 181602=DAOM 197198]|nr:hypothetical protein RIR_jg40078.t1 [Rhizophagus irregularis DAOM 181602=DAOM 197198]